MIYPSKELLQKPIRDRTISELLSFKKSLKCYDSTNYDCALEGIINELEVYSTMSKKLTIIFLTDGEPTTFTD